MKSSTILSGLGSLALAVSVHAVLVPRASRLATDTLLDDITNINTNVIQLTKNVEGFNGSLETVLVNGVPIIAYALGAHLATQKGFADAKTLVHHNFTDSQAAELVHHAMDTLVISNPLAVDATVAKKDVWARIGLTSLIVDTLKVLREDHQLFTNATLARFPPGNATLTEGGSTVYEVINQALTSGIAVLSS